MKLRDNLNTAEGYQKLINFRKTVFIEDIEEYEVNKHKWNAERVEDQFRQLTMYGIECFISEYSLGLPVSELTDNYKRCISFMEKGWRAESGYVEMLWMLSIGIMLHTEQDEFNKLVALVKRDNLKDYLINYLVHSLNPDWDTQFQEFEFPKPYLVAREIILLAQSDKGKAVERLQKYLQKEWYSGNKGSGWYDDHKSKWGVHFGYWSFESGALVKILGLDDSTLKGQQYYPYDMVHWQD